ncbi:hypothetical protein Tco_1247519 [Tanacetum coccineum]
MVDKGQDRSSGANDYGFIEAKKKKSGGNNGGTKNIKLISLKPKTTFHLKVNQSTAQVSPKTAPSSGKEIVLTSTDALSATAAIVSAVCQANDHGFGGIQVPKQKRNTGTKEMEVFLFR